jgi:Transmembrane secretion effector
VFLVAFDLKREAAPLWFFGVVAAASVSGGLAGTVVSPLLRRWLRRDEPLLVVALAAAATVSALAAVQAGRIGQVAAVLAVALGANTGRQSFDSVVQRDAPDAARGRAFARFETLFQLVWVIGALVAVVVQPTFGRGLVALGVGFGLTASLYVAHLYASRGSEAQVERDAAASPPDPVPEADRRPRT